MKVVILCGGRGYRLKEETEFKPKPMVLIGNQPILWHIMKIYSHHGFNEFIIALGYKGDYIKDYFLNEKRLSYNFTLHTRSGYTKLHKIKKDQSKDDFKITFVDTGLETLPGERILKVKEYIPKDDEDFMVTYGDGVSNVNIKELFKFHKKQNVLGTVLGVNPRSKFGLLKVNKQNLATKFTEKAVIKEWVNGGFMIFKKEAFKYLRKGEYEHEALKRLSRKKQLAVYIHKGFWHAMDTYNDVDSLNKFWLENPKWKVWDGR
ncbi:MAG: Glucose-1-phosphate cytidylyltransferase [Microgenomates group bacterium GW2011_GWA2_39_19]|nr:MAG: Glucose-1-phosphate cytidylyltransferase [Microgenomates group bacterium GW2011_GWA2_39_19]HBL52304.1 glucose-1-phosphate cytidylyltransferase [Candidatus Blackburnbacteria bacterium]